MNIFLIAIMLMLINTIIKRGGRRNPKRLLKELYDDNVIDDVQFIQAQHMSNLEMIEFMNEQMRLMDEQMRLLGDEQRMQLQMHQQEVDFMNDSLMHTGFEFGGFNSAPELNPSMHDDFNSFNNF